MDCSKTINFFAEAKRLCESRTTCRADISNKEQCPLFVFCESTIATRSAEDAIKAIENLRKWSNEHPKKTYAQDFFEKFPKAPKDKSAKSEYPHACRNMTYGGGCPKIESRIDCCYECWNEPMNDE
jgi:hypothetical protein